ncbi:hypothetical protein L3Q82_011021 [Scortum barcoo]|uniref:Uncharacterized protein n=1 Tax=Scortum barcoo TaxID=214431 RepID=A0ACB8W928_9TELE|nr:hypothetical protein L3Q82_011021 [Scortum barcoo]
MVMALGTDQKNEIMDTSSLEEAAEVVQASDQGVSFLWRFSGHVQQVRNPRAAPEHAGGITYLIWFGNASGSPRRSCNVAGERDVCATLLSLLPP